MSQSTIDEVLQDQDLAKVYAEELCLTDVLEALADWMELHSITQADLAERLGVSRSRVSQMFCGSKDIKARTIGRVAFAMGGRVSISVQPWGEMQKHYSTEPCRYVRANTVLSSDRYVTCTADDDQAWRIAG